MNEVPPAVFGEWVHSHEEDTQDTSVYRRPGYDFPPARGRRGFALKRDGGFVWHRIAAADGNVDSMGRWRIEDNDRIVATFEEKQLEPLKLDLISCDGDVLRIKRG
jgi:hypothetical protein